LENIQDNIIKIRSKIGNSEKITLVAISKSQPIEKIELAIKAGQREFGESYLKEALEKIEAIDNNEIIWHYIGKIQSNKAKLIATNFSWVQSVSSFTTAELLNRYRPTQTAPSQAVPSQAVPSQAVPSQAVPSQAVPLNICIQVNISEEANKSGVATDEILPLAKKIDEELPNLRLRGLMAIPAYYQSFEEQLTIFKKLSLEFNKLQQNYPHVDTLSMGMSHDFEAAIAAGTTMIRIGSAIFGKRD